MELVHGIVMWICVVDLDGGIVIWNFIVDVCERCGMFNRIKLIEPEGANVTPLEILVVIESDSLG
ncbi:hypothetical protein LINPERPRIM_LOCUS27784 [Linum perenne]